jgi:hypothetical protein
MRTDEIRRRKKDIEEQFGGWIHNIQLNAEACTRNSEPGGRTTHCSADKRLYHKQDPSVWKDYSPNPSRIRRVVQMIADFSKRPFEDLRILDLGVLEGAFSIELARRGATVVGIEGREANIVKAQFAKEALSLNNVDFILDDIRDVTEKNYGRFDVILCLGILYHLNAPDVFYFLERIAGMCDQFVIIDTELQAVPETSQIYQGRVYWGANREDHRPTATQEEKLENLCMSLDNVQSFIFTRFSLFNLLQQIGFSSVYECANPPVLGHGVRATFLAVKGQQVSLLTSPVTEQVTEEYSEVDSGRRDSELHVCWKYLRFALMANRFLNKLRR